MRARQAATTSLHWAAQAVAAAMALSQLAAFVLQNPYQIPSLWLRAALVLGLCLAGWRWAVPSVALLFAIAPLSGFVHLASGTENVALETAMVGFYLGWAGRRAVARDLVRAELPPVLACVHALILVIALSALAVLRAYPADFVVYRILRTQPLDQLDPLFAYRAALTLTLALCLFEVVWREGASWMTPPRLARLMAVQGSLVAILALVQLAFQYPVPRLPGLFAPFADVHSFAGYALLLYVYFLVTSLSPSQGRPARWGGAAIAVLFLGLLVLSNSRTSWLIAAIATAAAVLSRLPRRRALGWLAIGLVCLVLGGSGFLTATKGQGDTLSASMRHNLVVRLRNLIIIPAALLAGKEGGEVQTVRGRLRLWERALELGATLPDGVGIGSFYRDSAVQAAHDSETAPVRQNAHNWYLQVLAELGLPGLTLVAWLLWTTLATGRGDGVANPTRRALRFGLMAYAVSLLAGHHLILDLQQFCFFFLLAAQAALLDIPDSPPGQGAWSAVAIVVLALAGQVVVFGTASPLADWPYGLYPRQGDDPLGRRWTMRQFSLPVVVQGDVMALELQGVAPNLPGGRQVLRLRLDGRPAFELLLDSAAPRCVLLETAGMIGKKVRLSGESDASFNPAARGAGSDNRDLGVLMTKPRFLPACPDRSLSRPAGRSTPASP